MSDDMALPAGQRAAERQRVLRAARTIGKLRPHQVEALAKLGAGSDAPPRLLLAIPAGAGKLPSAEPLDVSMVVGVRC